MLRSLLLRASTNAWLAKHLPRRRFVRRAVRRFMPGEELEDALREVPGLEDAGMGTVLTLLGENVTSPGEAEEVADHYVEVLGQLEERGLNGEISVKPTQLGLDLDPDDTLVRLERLARHAARTGSWLWIDMEASGYVDPTLELYRRLRAGHRRVGVCLQAYLRRTPEDLESLLSMEPSIRLVKGAYAEPEEIAFPKKGDVDRAFLELTLRLLRARSEGADVRVAAATHDLDLIRRVDAGARELGLGRKDWEVQMLYGIGAGAQRALVADGHALRVLISYGPAWYPWYVRRLAERPANLWFVLKNIFG